MATTENCLVQPSIGHDLWEPASSRRHGAHVLTSIEVTVTAHCNLRCRHCAVGEKMVVADPPRIPLESLLRRLDEIPSLQTLSITGGEPTENLDTLRNYVLPLLQYAKSRGLQTQVNTNLTFDLARYEWIAPWTDAIHISWNYSSVEDFHRVAWGHDRQSVAPAATEKLFSRMVENTRALAGAGRFLSAESMVNRETAPHLGEMNRFLAELGCGRQEVHPMYPADWAVERTDLLLSLDEFRTALDRFLVERDPSLWVLFGTFPFLACSPQEADREMLRKAREARNVSVRNCPDGRNRLNINAFSGDILVTDFGAFPAIGNIQTHMLVDAFERWQQSQEFAPYNCYCPEAGCTGPNMIVAHLFHHGVDFRQRKAIHP